MSHFQKQHSKAAGCCFRAHSNGSIRRGFKTDTSEPLTMRSGLGVNLKDVTVFSRGREKGRLISPHSFLFTSCVSKGVIYAAAVANSKESRQQ